MNDETDIKLPKALIDRLQQRDRTVAMLTPRVDRAIARDSQLQFSARQAAGPLPRGTDQRGHKPRRSSIIGLAAAAAAAMVFVIVALRDPALPGDLDGSGTVDVLDAFRLSQELTRNPQLATNDSVDSLMRRIVALDGGLQ